jgi:hypothetical protein
VPGHLEELSAGPEIMRKVKVDEQEFLRKNIRGEVLAGCYSYFYMLYFPGEVGEPAISLLPELSRLGLIWLCATPDHRLLEKAI